MTAYNYQTQRWEKGNEAIRLHLAQLRKELEILKGERGQEYFLFCAGQNINAILRGEPAGPTNKAEAIAKIEAEIEDTLISLGNGGAS